MEILLIVLVVVILIICALIVTSILLQEDKTGGGIGIIGGSSQSVFGASSGSILSKITTTLFVIFMLLAVGLALISSSFSRDSLITETDISQTESNQYAKKIMTSAPNTIRADDFEQSVIAKITNENDKKILNTFYKKDVSNKYYKLDKKISKENSKKVVGIFNSVGFTLEAQPTVFDTTSAVDATSDISADKK
jgi:preprotein translocase subunit SecG